MYNFFMVAMADAVEFPSQCPVEGGESCITRSFIILLFAKYN
jgi:hypothetical protein